MKNNYRKVVLGAAASYFALTGCAQLIPDAVRPEFEHVSHLSQHEPLTDHPSNYGYNAVNLVLKWEPVGRVIVEASEGMVLSKGWRGCCGVYGYGGLEGPREVFTLRVGYEFRLK